MWNINKLIHKGNPKMENIFYFMIEYREYFSSGMNKETPAATGVL